MLEFIASIILWSTVDPNTGAELKASCEQVEFHYGGEPTANPVVMRFYQLSRDKKDLWTYTVPMRTTPTGALLLEPALYWVEEITRLNELTIIVENVEYKFDLTGSAKKLKCGDVVETRYTQGA